MELLIVRHAIAVEREAGVDDARRPLTPEGRRRFREAAAGLARLYDPPDAVWTSPLTRARQTAQIAVRAWRKKRPRISPVLRIEPTLAQADPGAFLRALARRGEKSIAVVGHEPHLSHLLARLIGVADAASVGFKKGGAALVEISASGSPRLVWFLPPRALRRLAP